ncbi:chromate transporter [Alkalibacter rhizosphaerae]|uniref:Chromate transporter n=1 Tax=Alkalibacter rhizosphaerae TaxID=2815577 RepID=A0A975AIC4_9FIRM|nr:chromate transporter [Alkalibacter rhizosphaerae]QSX09322.1 chromate transporter [Alkalibacter rhizosphaerae]
MRILLDIFVSFFKIGAFTVGGGFAMLPLFEEEFVRRRKWFTDQDFLNMLTVATAAPGPLAINSAVFTGYHVAGLPGVLVAIVGCIISPVIVILILAVNYHRFRSLAYADAVFQGIRPAVVGLMFAAVFNLVRRNKLRWTWYLLSVFAFILIALLKVDPVFVIALAGVAGVAFQRSIERRRR